MVVIAYMVVRIDISILPNHLKCTLMKEIGLSNRYRKSPNISDSKLSGTDKSHNNASDITDVIPIDDENNPLISTWKVKDALIKNRIRDYVAIRHPGEEGKLLVLTRNDAERQGKISLSPLRDRI
jgi:hypothetical protein